MLQGPARVFMSTGAFSGSGRAAEVGLPIGRQLSVRCPGLGECALRVLN